MVQEQGVKLPTPPHHKNRKSASERPETREENKMKIQARNTRSPRNKMLPEEHGVINLKTAFYAPGAGNWPGINDWHSLSRKCHYGLTRGL